MNVGLTNSMRLVPHDQDTGGFFVCVLEKLVDAPEGEAVAELPPVPALDDVIMADEKGASTLKRSASPSGIEGAESEAKRVKAEGEAEPAEESAKTEAAPEKKAGPSRTPKKVKKDASFKEDPYSFVDPNHEEVQSIV
jgi:multisite-specific tRNA:(cytosine-C5)-methyltransferase